MAKVLTAKQKMWVAKYIETQDIDEASHYAGYGKMYSQSVAEKFLTDPDILYYIKGEMERLARKANVNTEWVFKELKRIVERCMQEEAVTDKNGNFLGYFKAEHGNAIKALEVIMKYLHIEKADVQETPQVHIISSQEDREI